MRVNQNIPITLAKRGHYVALTHLNWMPNLVLDLSTDWPSFTSHMMNLLPDSGSRLHSWYTTSGP